MLLQCRCVCVRCSALACTRSGRCGLIGAQVDCARSCRARTARSVEPLLCSASPGASAARRRRRLSGREVAQYFQRQPLSEAAIQRLRGAAASEAAVRQVRVLRARCSRLSQVRAQLFERYARRGGPAGRNFSEIHAENELMLKEQFKRFMSECVAAPLPLFAA